MVAIKKTSTKITGNLFSNNAHLYVTRMIDPSIAYVGWEKGSYNEWHWGKYQIKETDMRTKTATFTSPNYVDLTTGVYCVLITSTMHESFGGVILNVEYDKNTGLYNYQCQDFSRFYQSTFEVINNGKATLYQVIRHLVSRRRIPLTGKVSKKLLNQYKQELSGLRPAYQYEQMYYQFLPSLVKKVGKMSKKKQKEYMYNPMTLKNKMIIRDKSFIEAIRDLVYGAGNYIDVYFTKNGTLKIEPYFVQDLYQSGLVLTTPEIADAKYKFDTTNIITGVTINGDKLTSGTYKSSKEMVNLDLTLLFGRLATSIKGETTTTTNKSKESKKSTNSKNNANPYNTKNKTVYISSDNIHGKSTDKKYMNDIAKILKKNGWKTKIVGVGPNTHYHINVKKGVWFCIYGGADAGLLKEQAGPSAYKNMEKKLDSRTVIGFKKKHGSNGPPCDIRKGGKCYKWLKRSSDNRPGFKGLNYPSKVLIKGKVPFMYAWSAEEMASKFLKGGDEPNAL